MKNKLNKKAIAFLLSFFMMFSIVVPNVFATENEQPTSSAVQTEEAPAEEIPAEEMPEGETPIEKIPEDETPAEELPTEGPPTQEPPAEEPPTEEPAAEEPATEELPAEEVPTEEVPMEELMLMNEPLGAPPVVEDACEDHTVGTVQGFDACVNAAGELHICENNFPDANFRNWMINVPNLTPNNNMNKAINDKGADGYLSLAELDAVTFMNVTNQGITDVTGICFFPNLEDFWFNNNNISSVDFSNNTKIKDIRINRSKIGTIDVSMLPELGELWVEDCGLTSLDVSNNLNLYGLSFENNELTDINLTNNPNLRVIYATGNELTSFEFVQGKSALERFLGGGNCVAAFNLNGDSAASWNLGTVPYNGYIGQTIPGQQLEYDSVTGSYILDMSKVVGAGNIGNIVAVNSGIYDSATGILNMGTNLPSESSLNKFYYTYRITYNTVAYAPDMCVMMKLEAPVPSVTPITLTFGTDGNGTIDENAGWKLVGDATRDKTVDEDDAMLISLHAGHFTADKDPRLPLTGLPLEMADVTGDKQVDADDKSQIGRMLYGLDILPLGQFTFSVVDDIKTGYELDKVVITADGNKIELTPAKLTDGAYTLVISGQTATVTGTSLVENDVQFTHKAVTVTPPTPPVDPPTPPTPPVVPPSPPTAEPTPAPAVSITSIDTTERAVNQTNGRESVPEYGGAQQKKEEGNWSLISLLCTIGTLAAGIMFVLNKKKKDKEEGTVKYRSGISKTIGAAAAAAGIVLAVLFINFKNQMTLVNGTTVWFALTGVVQAANGLLGKKKESL